MGPVPEIVLVPVRPDSALGVGALRGYTADLLGRSLGREATGQEVDTHLLGDPSDHLVPPLGVFVVALRDDETLGCAGLRYSGADVPPGAGEIKRMWVSPAARGAGLGTRMLDDLTELAREAGLSRLVLDTRSDLAEARGLYRRQGFVEVDAYNANPHAQVWYAKELW